MEKRWNPSKNEGLARTLIEPIANTLFKVRLAFLQHKVRLTIKVEEIFTGFNEFFLRGTRNQSQKSFSSTIGDKATATNFSENEPNSTSREIEDSTIEQYLFHILTNSTSLKSVFSSIDEILRENWFELHKQLGLPSLLPLYLFLIKNLIDVTGEYLKLNNKTPVNEDLAELDSLDRQQVFFRRI